jgi:hypothetical protein
LASLVGIAVLELPNLVSPCYFSKNRILVAKACCVGCVHRLAQAVTLPALEMLLGSECSLGHNHVLVDTDPLIPSPILTALLILQVPGVY